MDVARVLLEQGANMEAAAKVGWGCGLYCMYRRMCTLLLLVEHWHVGCCMCIITTQHVAHVIGYCKCETTC